MLEESNNFYTPNGIHVFTKDAMMNDLVDLEAVIANLEAKLPEHIRDGVEMIIVGRFDEFEERDINAFYKDGALYVSNIRATTMTFWMIWFTKQHTPSKSSTEWRSTETKNSRMNS